MEANLNTVEGRDNSLAASLASGGTGVCGCDAGSQARDIAEMKTQLRVMSADNRLEGGCHCVHVTYLHGRRVELEAMVSNMRTLGGTRPTSGVHGGFAPYA